MFGLNSSAGDETDPHAIQVFSDEDKQALLLNNDNSGNDCDGHGHGDPSLNCDDVNDRATTQIQSSKATSVLRKRCPIDVGVAPAWNEKIKGLNSRLWKRMLSLGWICRRVLNLYLVLIQSPKDGSGF
ncbi:hypothetical protein FJTKL_07404 [Diaporthe vaccinii]|uniref:Uncharacterized protein n=1 Tax=Diaporthe vaccinii TaxID=105482 RepID=A0ABR4EUH1_9PEZI